MALTLTALDVQSGGTQQSSWIAATPSGNYVVGGDTMDFTKILNPSFFPKPFPGRVPRVPPGVFLEEMGGVYTGIITGSTLSTFKLKFYTGGGAEFAAAAYAGQGSINLAGFNTVGNQQLVIQLIWPTGT